MADYFTSFSCLFNVGSAANADKAEDIRTQLETDLGREDAAELGFAMEHYPEPDPGTLWLHAEAYGDPEHVIAFVLRCAEAFELTGRWGFAWALTCSRPRLDGFGGGAQLIDLTSRRSLAWTNCQHWLGAVLDGSVNPAEGVAPG